MITPANPVAAFMQGKQFAQQHRQNEQQMRHRDRQLSLQERTADQQRQQWLAENMPRALEWADTPEKWDQAVDYMAQLGFQEAQGFRGRFDLRPALAQHYRVSLPAAAQEFEYIAQQGGFSDDERQQAARVRAGLAPRPTSAGIGFREVTGADGVTRLVSTDPRTGAVSDPDVQGLAPEQLASRPVEEQAGLTEQETQRARAGTAFLGDLNDTARKSSTENARLSQLESLLEQAYTGVGAEAVLSLQRIGQTLGIDTPAGPAEAARALSNQLALGLRNPAGGEGMPGHLSDRDLAFLKESIPSLRNTPDGWRTMIQYKRHLNEYAVRQAEAAEDYLAAGGRARDLRRYMQRWAESNPIFPEGGGGSPQIGTVVDGYRFKGGNPADSRNWERVR